MPDQQAAASDAATWLLLSARFLSWNTILGPFPLPFYFILFPGYAGPQASSKNVRDKSSERKLRTKGTSLPLS